MYNILYFSRYAGILSKGDEVLIQRNNELRPEKVIDVSSINLQGYYFLKYFRNYCLFPFIVSSLSQLKIMSPTKKYILNFYIFPVILQWNIHLLRRLYALFSGAYAPLTREGNIIVDDVLASCYADIDHDLAHISMTPIQWFNEALEWVLGYDIGFPVYVNIAKELRLWMTDSKFWKLIYYMYSKTENMCQFS